ncbi:hypothetical protein CC1G_13645 [Coprinopsis cinerea okayama7|uniref:Uncharacterized protein n=1 Tax=Coprinopsis cinerea (strain Okayama-7 / 130 / ATCC MYA-4618 / FGSC 9003) TaxID=240176 RepID=D6RJP0_COPC7|nr:hypothetical protein CC1G_13645 [Coprinopsis cinerea okayama7\|eukprot:XP_002912113.1 hypothetical protein CC1G_13645 [Coprinopsis cinerea okayama7\
MNRRFLGLLLILPLLAQAQDDDSPSSSPSATQRPTADSPRSTVITTTVLSEFVTTRNGEASTGTRTSVLTTTVPVGGDDGDDAGDNSSRRPSSTRSTPLPTAPEDVPRGGGTNGAPVPGATGVGGAYGPDDDFIAGALSLKTSAFAVSVAGAAVGAGMVLL